MEKELPISIHVHFSFRDDTKDDFEYIIGERKLSLIAISEEYNLYKYTYTCDDTRIGNDNRYGICSKNRIPITPQIYRDIYCWNKFLIAKKFGTSIDILNLQGQIIFNSIKTIEEHSHYTILKSAKDETTFLNKSGNILLTGLKEVTTKEDFKIFSSKDDYYFLHSVIVNTKSDTLIIVKIHKQYSCEKQTNKYKIDIYDCFNNSSFTYRPINETSDVYIFTLDSKYDVLFSAKHIQIISKYEKIELIPLFDSYYKIYSNNHLGILNAINGNELCPPIYDEIYCDKRGFKLQKDDKFGYITLGKGIVVETKYDDIYYKNNYFVLKKEDKVGIITESNYIIEPHYDKIEKLAHGYYAYLENNKWGIFNEFAKIIFQPYFNEIPNKRYENGLYLGLFIDYYWQVVDLNKKILLNDIYDYIKCTKRAIYARKGRNMYKIIEKEILIEKIAYDRSCGYINNPTILAFDNNLNDLLAAPTK